MYRIAATLTRLALGAAVVSGLALAPAPGRAADEPATDAAAEARKEKVEELYQLVGVGGQLAGVDADVKTRLRSRYQRDAKRLAAAERGVTRAFDALRVNDAVLAGLLEAYDAERIQEALTWWRSPLGRKVAGIREEMAGADAVAAVHEFGTGLAKDPIPAKRQKLADRLEAATQATEASLEGSAAVSLAVALALNELREPAKRLPLEDVRKRVAQENKRQAAARRHVTMVLILFGVRNLSDEELGQYVDFAESKGGQWYVTSLRQAMAGALDAAALRVPADVQEALTGGTKAASDAEPG